MGYLGEEFTEDEIGRITGMQVSRAALLKNDMDVLRENIAVLVEEKEKKALSESTLCIEDLEALRQKKRKRENTDT